MPKKGEYVKFKNFAKKIKLPFMIYVDFESILVPEDNRKQNPNESYTNKYKKHVACSYGYKLVCVAHRDCNINVKLNHKIPVFHNLKNYKMDWKSI